MQYELDELELGERVAKALAERAVRPVRKPPKRKIKKHLSECYISWARQFGWTGAHCTCLDWSPEI